MYACEVIYLINKGVISPYVQEEGGILLNFNITFKILHSFPETIALEIFINFLCAYINEDHSTSFFYKGQENWILGLLFFNFFMIIRVHFS